MRIERTGGYYMLTAKENLREVIKGKAGNPDRYVNQYEAVQLLPHPMLMSDEGGMLKPGETKVNAWGVTNSWPEGNPGQFPVHTPDKILIKDITNWRDYVHGPSLEFPQELWDVCTGIYDGVDGDKTFKAAFVVPGLFEQTHHFSEITNALMYYMINKQEMHDLIQYLVEWELELAEGICSHLHPDALFHHDDWGTESNSFLRPELFEEFFLEPYKTIYGYYHDHGVELVFHHSDSYAANLIPYMIEMGIDVWQGPMRTNNLLEDGLFDQYDGQITFMGNIDNKFVDFTGWTPEDCQAAAKEAIEGYPMTGYVPCICQGGPGSVYPGTYMELIKAIDQINAEKFGHKIEDIEDARWELQIMF